MAMRIHRSRPLIPSSLCAILCLGGAFLLAGCPAPTSEAPSPGSRVGKPVVVTSIFPLTDWVRQIAGDAVEVYTLLPAGASPHTYEPVPADAQRAAQASLLVVVGLGLDDWARKLAVGQHTQTLALGDAVEVLPDTEEHEHHGTEQGDPHVWLDPVRAAQMVAILSETLGALIPATRAEMEQRSSAYQAELRALAEEMPRRCAPYAGRRIVTMHAGFQYFLARCGLPPAEVITPFPGKEPSAQYLQAVALRARADGIKVIYAEPQFSPKAAEVLARELGGEVRILDNLGNPEEPSRNTYLRMMRFNLEELLRGLQATGGVRAGEN